MAAWLLVLGVFARWNLAPVLAMICLFALSRRQKSFLYSLGLSTIMILSGWYISTAKVTGAEPLVLVYQKFLNDRNYIQSPDEVINVLTRVDFYFSNFFFLTPPVALGVVAGLQSARCRQLNSRLRVELVLIPVSLIVYCLTMLFIGGHFSRFMTPIFPCALVSALSAVKVLLAHCGLPSATRLKVVATLAFLTGAWGAWPLYSLVLIQASLRRPPIFEQRTRQVLGQIPPETRLCAPVVHPLAFANGHAAMFEIRREIVFPTAQRDFTGAPVAESPTMESLQRLADACGPGSLLLIPAKHGTGFQAERKLYSDGTWMLVRNP